MNRPTAGAPHSALTVTTTAQTLVQMGLILNANTTKIWIMSDVNTIRFTFNGTTPTGTLGFPLLTTAWTPTELTLAQAESAKFIVASTTGTLQVGEIADI